MSITLDSTGSGYNLSTINNNFQKIEDEFNNKTLRRAPDAGDPNKMSDDIDMDTNGIHNCKDAVLASDVPNYGQTSSGAIDAANSAVEAAASAAEADADVVITNADVVLADGFAESAALSADEANGYVSTSELEVIARQLNILDAEVIYATDLVTELGGIQCIYDASTQVSWGIPNNVGATEVIVSISSDVLTTDVTTYTMIDAAVKQKETVVLADETYVTNKLAKSIKFTVVGAGGAGGGCVSNGLDDQGTAPSGSGGATVIKTVTDVEASYAIVVGNKGTGGYGNGNDGTVSSVTGVDITLTALPGKGSDATTSTDATRYTVGGQLGGVASGGDININGGASTPTYSMSGFVVVVSESGGSTKSLPVWRSMTVASGYAATGFGGGGGGGTTNGDADTGTYSTRGGNGSDGVVVVEEFF
jgi:hypothetical protein